MSPTTVTWNQGNYPHAWTIFFLLVMMVFKTIMDEGHKSEIFYFPNQKVPINKS